MQNRTEYDGRAYGRVTIGAQAHVGQALRSTGPSGCRTNNELEPRVVSNVALITKVQAGFRCDGRMLNPFASGLFFDCLH